MTKRQRILTRVSLTGFVLSGTLLTVSLMGGCYTKVVSSRGIGADSGDLRDAAQRDPNVEDRRVVRRQTYLGPGPSTGKKSE